MRNECEGIPLQANADYRLAQSRIPYANDPCAACIQAYWMGEDLLSLELAAGHSQARMGPWDLLCLAHSALQVQDLPLASELLSLSAKKGLPEAAVLWGKILMALARGDYPYATRTFDLLRQAENIELAWIADWVAECSDQAENWLKRL